MNRNQVAARKPPAPLAALLPLVLAGSFASITATRAAEWVERPFDPPAGSRWIIQTNETAEENRDGRTQTSVVTSTAELTIEQKLADGFRISYVVRNAAYQGGDPRIATRIESITKALQNLFIHATTAPNGMPLRIDNLAEIQVSARTAIDAMTAPLASQPQEAAVWRQLASRMLLADEQHAPAIYLASLVALAVGQNTGLHPGETRNTDDDVPNPFSGAPIKSNTSLRIDNADPATGTIRYIRTRRFDADAINAFLNNLARQVGGADSKHSQPMEKMVRQLAMTLDSRTEIEVEDGMTRTMRQEDTATAAARGRDIVKHGHKLITVTRAP